MKKIGIVMGSDSDLEIMRDACDILSEFGVEWEICVASAHRTPYKALDFAEKAEERGLAAIIAGAGAAAHLPGVLAAVTVLPVIGVPIAATPLNGLDSLYAIVQMPSGVPVASMAVNGARNAGLFALQILGTEEAGLRKKFAEYKETMAKKVEAKDRKVKETMGGKK